MTWILDLRSIIHYARSLSNKTYKLDYLATQNRDVRNFLGGNVMKNGVAKTIASKIPINESTTSSMEHVIDVFEFASNVSKQKDKIRLMKTISLDEADREFVLTCLYGSLKLGLKIPLPDPVFGETIKPQLCGTGIEFNPSEYIIEEKFDGVRCIASNDNGNIVLQSRNGKILDIPFIKKSLKNCIQPGVTIDGEIISLDGQFQSIDRKSENLIYVVFDIPFIKYQSTLYGLNDRKVFVDLYVTQNKNIKISPILDLKNHKEIDYWIEASGAEGIVAKDPESYYSYNDRKNWIKYKKFLDMSCHVVGYTDGAGRRKGKIGAINVIPDGLNDITKVGSGFTDEMLDKMKSLIDDNNDVIVDVKYQNITDDNKSLRFPVFLRIRKVNGDEI